MDHIEAATRIVEAILGREGGFTVGNANAADHDALVKSAGADAAAIFQEVYAGVNAAQRVGRNPPAQ